MKARKLNVKLFWVVSYGAVLSSDDINCRERFFEKENDAKKYYDSIIIGDGENELLKEIYQVMVKYDTEGRILEVIR